MLIRPLVELPPLWTDLVLVGNNSNSFKMIRRYTRGR